MDIILRTDYINAMNKLDEVRDKYSFDLKYIAPEKYQRFSKCYSSLEDVLTRMRALIEPIMDMDPNSDPVKVSAKANEVNIDLHRLGGRGCAIANTADEILAEVGITPPTFDAPVRIAFFDAETMLLRSYNVRVKDFRNKAREAINTEVNLRGGRTTDIINEEGDF